MAKSLTLDRVKVIAEMARQDITGEELAQKAVVGRCAVNKARRGQPVYRTTAQRIANALNVPLETLMED